MVRFEGYSCTFDGRGFVKNEKPALGIGHHQRITIYENLLPNVSEALQKYDTDARPAALSNRSAGT